MYWTWKYVIMSMTHWECCIKYLLGSFDVALGSEYGKPGSYLWYFHKFYCWKNCPEAKYIYTLVVYRCLILEPSKLIVDVMPAVFCHNTTFKIIPHVYFTCRRISLLDRNSTGLVSNCLAWLWEHFSDKCGITTIIINIQQLFEWILRCYFRAVEVLTQCMSDMEIAEAFKQQQIALNHGLPLGSYLLKPVQRILKYHLLLQVWMARLRGRGGGGRVTGSRFTKLSNPDSTGCFCDKFQPIWFSLEDDARTWLGEKWSRIENMSTDMCLLICRQSWIIVTSRREVWGTIERALESMTCMAQHINEMKRKHEHAVRIQEIQSTLYGWEGADLTTFGDLVLEACTFIV